MPRSTQDDEARQLPKKFFEAAAMIPTDGGFGVALDGRAVKTPKRAGLAVPTAELGEAIAAEWSALDDTIDPQRLPLTKLANTAIDGVAGRLKDVHDDIVRYIGNDLLFYRAQSPEPLVLRQAAAWDPVLEWFAETYDATFKTTTGIMPIEQSPLSVARAASAISDEGAMTLTPLHVMTTLTGSALLTIAHFAGRLSVDEVWQATHVDEDWQIEQWGRDEEAELRRAQRRAEMEHAATFLRLVRA